MHKLNYLYSLYVYMCVCLSTRQNSLFSGSSIEFNKILCLCVCLPPSTVPLNRLPSGQNATTPNVAFLTVLSLIPLLCFYILKLELFQ